MSQLTVSQKLAQRFNEFPISRFKVRSKSRKELTHLVELYKDGTLTCTCEAGAFQKPCSHKNYVRRFLRRTEKKH